ncbi:MAG: hypothetical protein WBX01_11020 [Nitrososphaeraceae archaeon]
MIKGNVERGKIYSYSKNNLKDKNKYPNQGFSQRDQNYLRKQDNFEVDPQIQFFTEEELEDKNEIEYFCKLQINWKKGRYGRPDLSFLSTQPAGRSDAHITAG